MEELNFNNNQINTKQDLLEKFDSHVSNINEYIFSQYELFVENFIHHNFKDSGMDKNLQILQQLFNILSNLGYNLEDTPLSNIFNFYINGIDSYGNPLLLNFSKSDLMIMIDKAILNLEIFLNSSSNNGNSILFDQLLSSYLADNNINNIITQYNLDHSDIIEQNYFKKFYNNNFELFNLQLEDIKNKLIFEKYELDVPMKVSTILQ